MNLPARITIREVGARDGLQSEAPLDVDDRLELLDALLIAGVTHLEVAAFVSPAAVPAMAGAADVVAGLGAPEGVVRAALVPNVRGAELALAAGIDELTVTISASATYNQRNVRMSFIVVFLSVSRPVPGAPGFLRRVQTPGKRAARHRPAAAGLPTAKGVDPRLLHPQ